MTCTSGRLRKFVFDSPRSSCLFLFVLTIHVHVDSPPSSWQSTTWQFTSGHSTSGQSTSGQSTSWHSMYVVTFHVLTVTSWQSMYILIVHVLTVHVCLDSARLDSPRLDSPRSCWQSIVSTSYEINHYGLLQITQMFNDTMLVCLFIRHRFIDCFDLLINNYITEMNETCYIELHCSYFPYSSCIYI